MLTIRTKLLHLLFISLLLSGCTAIRAGRMVGGGEIAAGTTPDATIQYEITEHPMLIKVRLNDSKKEYEFIFDTGALTLISSQVAEELQLQGGVKIKGKGAGGNSRDIQLTLLDTIAVGSAEVKDCAAAIVDFPGFGGSDIAGLLGSNFLRFFRVTIDYQKKEILLGQSGQPMPAGDRVIALPFETEMKNGFAPQVTCTIDDSIQAAALIDTGFPGLASLPYSIIEQTKSFRENNVLTAQGSMSSGIFGKDEESFLLRLKTLKIGSLELDDIPSFSHSLTDENLLLGNGFLSKFRVTLDYPEKQMILEPYGQQFEKNTASYGLAVFMEKQKTVVSGVWEHSSAFESGLRPGDEIVEINSQDPNAMSMFEIMALFLERTRRTMEIKYIQDNREVTVTLHKKNILPDLTTPQ